MTIRAKLDAFRTFLNPQLAYEKTIQNQVNSLVKCIVGYEGCKPMEYRTYGFVKGRMFANMLLGDGCVMGGKNTTWKDFTQGMGNVLDDSNEIMRDLVAAGGEVDHYVALKISNEFLGGAVKPWYNNNFAVDIAGRKITPCILYQAINYSNSGFEFARNIGVKPGRIVAEKPSGLKIRL